MATNFPSTAFPPRTIHLGLSAFGRDAIEHPIAALIALTETAHG